MPAPAVMTMASAFLMISFARSIASCNDLNLSVSMLPPMALNAFGIIAGKADTFLSILPLRVVFLKP